ncbi:MAG TPA: hypothetical protein VM536_13605, partial [Chloroflexia bacterium]|nr:hypothetical protein [Chloroflexia bacterium]
QEQAPVQAPVVAPPAAAPAPAVQPQSKPVSNVKPSLGFNDTAAKPAPRSLPSTGTSSLDSILFALTGALALALAGLGARRAALTSR